MIDTPNQLTNEDKMTTQTDLRTRILWWGDSADFTCPICKNQVHVTTVDEPINFDCCPNCKNKIDKVIGEAK